jgi:hypothetical protein
LSATQIHFTVSTLLAGTKSMKKVLTGIFLSLLGAAAQGQPDATRLEAAVNAGHRTDAYVARDKYRHPQ